MPYDFPSSPVNGQVSDNYVYSSEKQSWVSGDSVEALSMRVANAELLAPVGSIHAYAGGQAPSGYLFCQGQAVSRSQYARLFNTIGIAFGSGDGSTTFNIPNLQGKVVAGSQAAAELGTATITIATPAVVTETGHGLATGHIVSFKTTGSLPTGITAGNRYWAIVVDSNTFRLATSLANALAGTAIATSGSQSGTHTVSRENYGFGQENGTETHTLTVSELPSHTHIQDSHNHTQQSHNHTQNAHSHNSDPYWYVSFPGGYGQNSTNYGPRMANPSFSGMYEATATNQNTTATNQNTTATNQNTGGGGAHNNLQPYNTVNYIIKF